MKTASTTWTSNGSMGWNQAFTESYAYDPGNDMLTGFATTDGFANPNQSWNYDAAGNRNDTVADNLNRAVSIGGVATTHDILGNRLTKGSDVSYTWDLLNRMQSFTNPDATTSYAYRADGMRVKKASPGHSSVYRYEGQSPVEIVETTGTVTKVTDQILGARGVDAETTNGVTTYPVYDGHGNRVATLNTAGNMSDQRVYDPWGNLRSAAQPGTSGRYCASIGHLQDDETGMVYMRARYYEPGSGRFVSEDPGLDGGNWFTYCRNNPVNCVDKSGKELAGAALGALLGFVSSLVIGLCTGVRGVALVEKVLIGTFTGMLSGLIGVGIVNLATETTIAVLMIAGAAGGSIGSGANEFLSQLAGGGALDWRKIGRAFAFGGAFGLAFGAIGGAMSKNAELAGAVASIDGDLAGNAAETAYSSTHPR